MTVGTPPVDDVVREALRTAPWEAAHALMRTLTTIDRYQASDGIERAADVVAEACAPLGLSAPTLSRYRADAEPQWWAFRAPLAWTPHVATLSADAGGRTLRVDHGRNPFALATYSAAIHVEAWPSRRIDAARVAAGGLDLRGVVCVVDADVWRRSTTIPALEAAGASVVLVPSVTTVGGRARVELRPGSPLTVFALVRDEHALALELAGAGTPMSARVQIGSDATMPVSELVVPGTGENDQELWVTAHLCHGRPGANDNVSGVAATLMTAAVLHRRARLCGPLPRTVRFVWGPEYLATAAALADTKVLPSAVVNLDMVGEDPATCRAPFVRESVSPTTPSDLEWQSDHAVSRAFALTSDAPGTWRTDPFLGFSDHALCGDPAVGVPAVAFCHPDDPFNHSEDDTLDKVSRTEMLRAVAAATATLALQAGAAGPEEERAVARSEWAARILTTARARAQDAAVGDPRWAASYLDWTRRQLAPDTDVSPPSPHGGAPVLRRHWQGPVNVRALLGDVPPVLAARNTQRVTADKRWLSVLFNAAIRIDGVRSADAVLDDVSMNAGRPLTADDRELLIEVLLASGWVTEHVPDQ